MVLKIFNKMQKHKFGVMVLVYYMTLVLMTDCFVWYQLKNIKGYSVERLIIYSFLAAPLWTIWGRKGTSIEMIDFISSGRQFHLDILPISYSHLHLISFLAKTLK